MFGIKCSHIYLSCTIIIIFFLREFFNTYVLRIVNIRKEFFWLETQWKTGHILFRSCSTRVYGALSHQAKRENRKRLQRPRTVNTGSCFASLWCANSIKCNFHLHSTGSFRLRSRKSPLEIDRSMIFQSNDIVIFKINWLIPVSKYVISAVKRCFNNIEDWLLLDCKFIFL